MSESKVKKSTKKHDDLEKELVGYKKEIKDYKMLLKKSEKWVYNDLELNIIKNRLEIMAFTVKEPIKRMLIRETLASLKKLINHLEGE